MSTRHRIFFKDLPNFFFLFISISLLISSCSRPGSNVNIADPNTIKEISSGKIVGFNHDENTYAWLGIPYAKAPVGNLRWMAPRPPIPWDGVRESIRFGNACTQIGSIFGDPSAKEGSVHGSEDCLFLNVFSPSEIADQSQLPVMVWIHGGSNTIGTSNLYDPSVLVATQKVIVVTINYRLGLFGWFYHPSLSRLTKNLEDASGNYGTLDHIAALTWVKQNISQFGGDPENVTIFGESAGGRNVYALMVSPLAKGLFHKAISQSGGTNTSDLALASNYADHPEYPGTESSSREILNTLLNDSGLVSDHSSAKAMQNSMTDLEISAFLRSLNKEKILHAFSEVLHIDESMHTVLSDGYVLPQSGIDFADAPSSSVPFITGTNRDEMKLFLAFDPEFTRRFFFLTRIKNKNHYKISAEYGSKSWKIGAVDNPARNMVLSGNKEVYAYRFDWDEEPRRFFMDLSLLLGAGHAIEIPFVMGNLSLGGLEKYMFRKKNFPAAKALSNAMMSYWAEFAYYGRPSNGRENNLPTWSSWDIQNTSSKFIIFDTQQDGGIRMSGDELTYKKVMHELISDPRIPNDKIRCQYIRTAIDGDWDQEAIQLGREYCDRSE
jgi:para-nitrobenzyl esterase